MRIRHWICAAALSGGLLMGGMAAFSAYATSVEIEDAKKQVSALEEEKKKFDDFGQEPIILTSQVIRVYIYRLLEPFYPNIHVLSFSEITNTIQIQAIGTITA